jgi:uroporphyrinogen decarboxylase
MTGRERVVRALKHQEADKIPIDLGATESSGITAMACNVLKRHLGIDSPTRVYDLGQLVCLVEPALMAVAQADAVPVLVGPREWQPWSLPDGSPALVPATARIQPTDNGYQLLSPAGIPVAHCPRGGWYFDSISHPLQGAATVADLAAGRQFCESFDLPFYSDQSWEEVGQQARRFFRETDYALVGNLWVHLLAAGADLRGYENFLIDLASDKRMAHRFLSQQVESYLPRIDSFLQAVGEYVQVIQVNDDLGSQQAPLISPELYREMIKPYHGKLWRYIKGKSGKFLLLHSCGSIYELIPDLIELGVDALNPVQVSAANMDTGRLKRQFGRQLTFWGGGCDTQTVLRRGSVAEVREEVSRRIDDLADGGGFVFCPVHNIQPDVPPQNILAMYEEANSFHY